MTHRAFRWQTFLVSQKECTPASDYVSAPVLTICCFFPHMGERFSSKKKPNQNNDGRTKGTEPFTFCLPEINQRSRHVTARLHSRKRLSDLAIKVSACLLKLF